MKIKHLNSNKVDKIFSNGRFRRNYFSWHCHTYVNAHFSFDVCNYMVSLACVKFKSNTVNYYRINICYEEFYNLENLIDQLRGKINEG